MLNLFCCRRIVLLSFSLNKVEIFHLKVVKWFVFEAKLEKIHQPVAPVHSCLPFSEWLPCSNISNRTWRCALGVTWSYRAKHWQLYCSRCDCDISRETPHTGYLESHIGLSIRSINLFVQQVPMPIMIINHKQPFLIGKQNLRQHHQICQGLD